MTEKNPKYSKKRRKRTLVGKYTAHQIKRLFKQCGNVCVKCLKTEKLTLDHILPVALGGYNTVNNIQPMCAKCNNAKGLTIIDYRPLHVRKRYTLR